MANRTKQTKKSAMERIRIHIPPRRAIDAPAPNATLFVGAASIVIDEQNLPSRLVRLLPHAYGTANHPDRNQDVWVPFVATARAMGILAAPASQQDVYAAKQSWRRENPAIVAADAVYRRICLKTRRIKS